MYSSDTSPEDALSVLNQVGSEGSTTPNSPLPSEERRTHNVAAVCGICPTLKVHFRDNGGMYIQETFDALIDSGSQVSLISADAAAELVSLDCGMLQPVRAPVLLKGVTGNTQECSQEIEIDLHLGPAYCIDWVTLLIVPTDMMSSTIILGVDTLIRNKGLIIDIAEGYLKSRDENDCLYNVAELDAGSQSAQEKIKLEDTQAPRVEAVEKKDEGGHCLSHWILAEDIRIPAHSGCRVTFDQIHPGSRSTFTPYEHTGVPLKEKLWLFPTVPGSEDEHEKQTLHIVNPFNEDRVLSTRVTYVIPDFSMLLPFCITLADYAANLCCAQETLDLQEEQPGELVAVCHTELFTDPREEELEMQGYELPTPVNAENLEDWTEEKLSQVFELGENPLVGTRELRGEVTQLLLKYASTISKGDHDIGSAVGVEHQIELKNEKPVYIPRRRFQGQLEAKITEMCERMCEEGVIRHSKSPWNSNPVPVLKPNGDLRLCVDFRPLNAQTRPQKYPLPNIHDLIYSMHGMKFFSTIDLVAGFHQIKMEESSIPYTAFSTPNGHYEFVRMPFGLVHAPLCFQKIMNEALADLPAAKVRVYLDDVLIATETWDEHLVMLSSVFEALQKVGLKIKPVKCDLFRSQVNFLGYKMSNEGLLPLEKNLKGVSDFPRPSTTKQVRSFLGMAGFYRVFVPNFGEIAKPMSSIVGSAKLNWAEEQEEAFKEIKKTLVSPKVLAFPNHHPDAEMLQLHVDASEVGMGAVLSQEQEGQLRPIAYISSTFSGAQRRYSTTEKELTALRWSVKTLRPFLAGTKFVIYTDHQALVYLQTTSFVNNRLARTLEDLSLYDFVIRHIPGKLNVVADALSRSPTGAKVDFGDNDCPPENVFVPQGGEVKLVPGGGNSLFAALEMGMEDTMLSAIELRRVALQELERSPKTYGLLPTTDVKKRLKKMSPETAYVDWKILIPALCHKLKKQILVYLSTRHPLQFGAEYDSSTRILLQCLEGVHFNYIEEVVGEVPDNGPAESNSPETNEIFGKGAIPAN